MDNYFPVRPKPYNNECLKGYLLRIAALHGYSGFSDIFNVIGLKYNSDALEQNTTNFDTFIERIAPYLLESKVSLLEKFSSINLDIFDSDRCIKSIIRTKPNICIACLGEEHSYLNDSWRLAHVTHCLEHKTILTSVCPQCSSCLFWHTDIKNGCPSCGTRWCSLTIEKGSTLPVYQLMVTKLTGDDRKLYLQGLYQALLIATRPYDFFNNNLNKVVAWPDNLHDYFSYAYNLLSKEEYRYKLVHQVNAELSQAFDAINIESLQKINHGVTNLPRPILPYDDEHEFSNLSSTTVMLPKVFRSRMSLYLNSEKPNAMFSDKQAGDILGISASQLNELARTKIIDSLSFSSQLYYSAAAVNKLLEDIMKDMTAVDAKKLSGLLSLSDVGKWGDKYLSSFAETIELIFTHKEYLFRDVKSNNFTNVYIHKNDLLRLLRENLNNQFKALLPASKVAKFLCFREHKVKLLGDALKWRRIQINNTQWRYEPEDVKTFYQNYLVLDKWCGEHNCSKPSLYSFLRAHNFEPLSVQSGDKWVFHIFKKSENLFVALNKFEANWMKQRSPRNLLENFNQDRSNFHHAPKKRKPINYSLINRQESILFS
ncbi:TniQ family protein [Thalassomonas sp. M1454]|uniref:TniQ family protein n=1 Tax=Thalassomonas sp. M1454 TaxID=2594477 RepID=UPI00117DB3B8|nr:TniQ family protein [Thalassomonas sp. M1454]TRX55166.1 hypothetical protein FNN08_11290 [Thalassomonas sp. M1454]